MGKIDLGASFPSGNYNVKIKSGRHLRKLIPGIVNIVNLKDNAIPQTFLVTGDVNDDNQINDEMNGEKKQDANKPYRPWRCGKSLFM